VDLRDLWRRGGGRSGLTPRLLRALIDGLPPESATKTAVRDDLGEAELAELAEKDQPSGHGPWSHTDLRIASLIDEVRWLRYAVYQSAGAKPKQPNPYPRPGVRSPDAGREITEAGRAYLEKLRTRRVHAAS